MNHSYREQLHKAVLAAKAWCAKFDEDVEREKERRKPTLEDAQQAARWCCERIEDPDHFASYILTHWPWLAESIQKACGGDD